MNKATAIRVQNLSKAYQLGQIGTGTISRDFDRFWKTKIRRKEDPYLKIGQINDRTRSNTTDLVWSLMDLNFEIKQGEAIGIIGRNGAGKSTLLKILSRVTGPTKGSISIKGRIASLLEVGTGFHPELTGRENIFLNGAILGMRKFEIASKFDEIVDFAGVEKYIDTPVKRYSSGMYVRLAFAVAAHLDSEILIVDEVLAVGDAEFQKKCLGKMGAISQGEGRTVLFVSHNMTAVKNLCSQGILLENGKLLTQSNIENVVNQYTLATKTKSHFFYELKAENTGISAINISNNLGKSINVFKHNEDIIFEIDFQVFDKNVVLSMDVKDNDFNIVFGEELQVKKSGKINALIPGGFLIKGTFIIDFHMYLPNKQFYDKKVDEVIIIIDSLPERFSMYGNDNVKLGIVSSPIKWSGN
jgi:lipopolysaccharide transport system ATP-binding protein